MCLLSVLFRAVEGFPIVLFANREESRARPTGLPAIQADPAALPWVGAIDLLAGGTWLGVSRRATVVAVTNRPRQDIPESPESRGLLCRRILQQPTYSQAITAAQADLESGRYAGCNLLIASRERAVVFEWGDVPAVLELDPGIHVITNGDLNDANDSRLSRVRNELEAALSSGAKGADWLVVGRRLCALHDDEGMPAICRHGAAWGTVSSSLLLLGDDLSRSRYQFANGIPCENVYSDYTPLLRRLFRSSGGRTRQENASALSSTTAAAHQIRLRGPWQYQWLSGGDPLGGTVHMPGTWQEQFGPTAGRVRLRRRFHRPTNLGRLTRVFAVFTGIRGCGRIHLNGEELGGIEPSVDRAEFELTARLQPANELVVELRYDPGEMPVPGGLYGPVLLEIRTDAY